jgi:hypothetical protein
MEKYTQNYSQYYQGPTPEYRAGGSVDFSQLSSLFSRTSETMDLVYKYAPSISQEVSYIFDFSNNNAYGVYIPALVEEIKTNELKRILADKGYSIENENGLMVAKPTQEGKSQEDIEAEIKQLWEQINSGKSEVLGVNMNKVRSSCEQNMRDLVSSAEAQGVEINNPNLLWDMLVMLELGATIVHEWAHSRGGDEGDAQGTEKDFIRNALPHVKQKYEGETGETFPADFTVAKSSSWYKVSQSAYPFKPPSPTGSDLSGRHGQPVGGSQSLAPWGMLMQMHQSMPIENLLGKQFMWDLAPDISQEHDSIEEQLRKHTRDSYVPDTKLIYEELLSKDHNNDAGYKSLETLMEERRPQPLMVPLKKEASLKKEATLFGWYNNLDIGDGSTTAGLGDRVMLWRDRSEQQENFSEEEYEIKRQNRYNPEYDLKGFYYRWIEPQFKPQLFDDYNRDYSNATPARRFASVNQEISKILHILGEIQSQILNRKIKATRLLISEDLYFFVKKNVLCDGLKFKAFRFSQIKGENIYAIWVTDKSISNDLLLKAEKQFRKKSEDESEDIAEDLLGLSMGRSKAIKEVIIACRKISRDIKVDVYAVGMYARDKAMGIHSPNVSNVDLTTVNLLDNTKLASALSKMLGVDYVFDSGQFEFCYKGIKINITGKNSNKEKELIKGHSYSNQVEFELLKRDFTLNMLAYNIRKNKILDPLKVSLNDLHNGVLRTLLDPKEIISLNPLLILRAMKLKLQYHLAFDSDLEDAIVKNINNLMNKGLYSNQTLVFARESVVAEDAKEAEKLFNAYGLWDLKQLTCD